MKKQDEKMELLKCPFCGVQPQKGMAGSSVWCQEQSCFMFGKAISLNNWNTRTPSPSKVNLNITSNEKEYLSLYLKL